MVNAKLLAVLLITEIIVITTSESLSLNPKVKRTSLKERLQNIAKEAKRAKNIAKEAKRAKRWHGTTWSPSNEYDQGTQGPDFDYTTYAPDYDYNTNSYEYDGMTTISPGNYDYNTENYENYGTTPYSDYGYTEDYNSYTTMGYWEYRHAEEARERHEEHMNPSHGRGTTRWPFWSHDKKVDKKVDKADKKVDKKVDKADKKVEK